MHAYADNQAVLPACLQATAAKSGRLAFILAGTQCLIVQAGVDEPAAAGQRLQGLPRNQSVSSNNVAAHT